MTTTIQHLIDVMGYGLPMHVVGLISAVVAASEATDAVVETQHVISALNHARQLPRYGAPHFTAPIDVLDAFAHTLIAKEAKEYLAVIALLWRPWAPKNIVAVLEGRLQALVTP